MTSRVLLFDPVERFVAGTVGQPGERTFFIQARHGSRLISVSCEKSQVQALADRLTYMVREIKQSDPTVVLTRLMRDDGPLETPIEEEFRVGVIGIAFDDSRQLIQIDLQAVSESDQEEPDFIDVDDLSGDQDILRVLISPSVADQFSKRALSVVNAGRQPCPFCGGPIDLRGHLCPRANGYRR
jgi:uncharacterized repeat protein (TIGR03847 family)